MSDDGNRTVTIADVSDASPLGRYVEIVSPGTPPVLRVAEGVARIGREAGHEVVIDDPSISRAHLEVTVRADRIAVRDLETRNGTWYRGARIRELTLRGETTLVLGRECVVRLRVIDPAAAHDDAAGELVGQSAAIAKVRRAVERVAGTPLTVLIEGETGTGKEVIARAIHARSERAAKGPFVVFDCASVSPTLLASELFGHTRGAYTGATGASEGAFRRARGGTLFIDEIGELPLELQPQLLRALEAREVKPVGGDAYLPIDVRIVAATNRELEAEVAAGRFRKDLLFRLAVARVRVPPLAARADDVPVLARHFAQSLEGAVLAPEVLASLAGRTWPGNVRELRNEVERLVMLAGGPGATVRSIEADDEPAASGDHDAQGPTMRLPQALPAGMSYQDLKQSAVDAFEREYLVRLYAESGHNLAEAARRSGVNRRYLDELYKKHRIDRAKLREGR